MKYKLLQAGLSLFALTLGSSICLAQKPTKSGEPSRANPENRILTELQQRGLENLDRVAFAARQIENPGIRADLQSLIGDALWDFDQSHAKNIFRDAFKNALSLEDKRVGVAVATQVLKHVWQRDRALAEELMKQMSNNDQADKPEAAGDFGVASQFGMKSSDPASQQRLDLARSLLNEDPSAAGELIASTLRREVSFSGINLLTQLKAGQPDMANEIFSRALTQLGTMPSTNGIMSAIAMGDYVFPNCTLCSQAPADAPMARAYYAAAIAALRQSLGQRYTPPPVRPELQGRLTQYFHQMQALLALNLTKFAKPDEVEELQNIFRQQVGLLEPRKQQSLQALEKAQKVTDRFADLSEKADSVAGAEERDQAWYSIVSAALREKPSPERLEQLEKIVEKIQTPKLHTKALSVVTSLRAEALIKAGELDQAYALITTVPEDAIRATTLRKLALEVSRKGSQTLISNNLLTQALEAAEKAEPSVQRSQMAFMVTGDFLNLKDHDGAFKALASASASLAPLGQADFADKPQAAVPNSLFPFSRTFGALGSVDFDRTMFLAQSIKWREFRLAAEIATCRAALMKRSPSR